MHSCPECDQVCDCDLEDHENDIAPDDCTHECDYGDESDYSEGTGE